MKILAFLEELNSKFKEEQASIFQAVNLGEGQCKDILKLESKEAGVEVGI